ncbi:hypothetical protein A8990_11434 [Paenibacillus taihuensis]|uniref:Uncharacterized protein n=1 Tax=Paenibacillus taihuensis TaxID=1156355 RepID=A0A3D9RX00_9BACL|nr:hypothetical protein A8990_11434 [Paenibacillus taihuensis]
MLNAVVPTFYRGVHPLATMIIDDLFLLPIPHSSYEALNGRMKD